LKADKKNSFKKKLFVFLIILAALSAAAIIFLVLLFYKPSYYKPVISNSGREESIYLTHELGPELYNGAQMQEPFDLVVTQEGINDIIAHRKWPQQFSGIMLSTPMVFFVADSVVLMGMISTDGTELVITITAYPKIDADGLLNLNVDSVKIGAVDITPLAAVLAKKVCRAWFENKDKDKDYLWNKIAVSIVNGRPFEPVFKVEDKKVRVKKISLEQKKLTICFVPVPD
jgi:uncharacterized protein YpmS